VDNTLGETGSSRTEQDESRMIERKLLECDIRGEVSRGIQKVLPCDAVRNVVLFNSTDKRNEYNLLKFKTYGLNKCING
jgi:hypothetical protein